MTEQRREEHQEAGTEGAEQEERLSHERWELLEHVDALTEKPMVALGFVWLALLVLDFTTGLSPALQVATNVIWVVFIVDFVIEFLIAPHKPTYLKKNWLTAVSLLLPALRVFRAVRIFRTVRALRFARAARAARSTSLVRLITSLNRGMRAVRASMGKRGFGYILGLTTIVLVAGAAGMWTFENPASLRAAGVEPANPGSGLASYSEALWWTAMVMTTLGSEYWPQTAEGRILSLLLSIYALAVLGYITANIASYFIGKDGATGATGSTGEAALVDEISALRKQIDLLSGQLSSSESPAPSRSHSNRAGAPIEAHSGSSVQSDNARLP